MSTLDEAARRLKALRRRERMTWTAYQRRSRRTIPLFRPKRSVSEEVVGNKVITTIVETFESRVRQEQRELYDRLTGEARRLWMRARAALDGFQWYVALNMPEALMR